MRLQYWCAGMLGAVLAVTGAFAQDLPQISRDLYTEHLGRDGDRITVCYNPDSMLAPFDQRVARMLGDALLLETSLTPYKMPLKTPPLDYRLPIDFNQLFLVLAECDAFMGFVLGGGTYPDWVRLTEPYLTSTMALVVTDPAVRRISDLPAAAKIGTRALSAADNRLISYLNAIPEDRRWQRQTFFSNDQVLAALSDGRLGAAMVWRPALDEAIGRDLGAAGLHEIELPFNVDPVSIGIILRSVNSYLQVSLSDAIRALLADGSIQKAYDETIGVE